MNGSVFVSVYLFLGVFICNFIMIVYLIASFKILHWMSSLLPQNSCTFSLFSSFYITFLIVISNKKNFEMSVDKMKGKNTLGTEATVKIGQILLCSIVIVFMFFP